MNKHSAILIHHLMLKKTVKGLRGVYERTNYSSAPFLVLLTTHLHCAAQQLQTLMQMCSLLLPAGALKSRQLLRASSVLQMSKLGYQMR
jgi:hypothetical protein